MIKDVEALQKFEDSVIRGRELSHPQALSLFDAMWQEGVVLGVLPPEDPLEGIEVDLRIARIVNSCSKKSGSSDEEILARAVGGCWQCPGKKV
jgi:hypothetical protein